jgi:hypothetical protein
MPNALEEKKKKIDEQIEKNLLRKKLLLEKEKRKRASKFNEIGRLAYRANIDQLDEQALFGAFLEIAKNINEEKMIKWKEFAEEFSKAQSKSFDQVFSIYFEEDPSQEIKRKLKENKFSWNRFRKEYYGKGNRGDIENLLKDCKVKIEEIIH